MVRIIFYMQHKIEHNFHYILYYYNMIIHYCVQFIFFMHCILILHGVRR